MLKIGEVYTAVDPQDGYSRAQYKIIKTLTSGIIDSFAFAQIQADLDPKNIILAAQEMTKTGMTIQVIQTFEALWPMIAHIQRVDPTPHRSAENEAITAPYLYEARRVPEPSSDEHIRDLFA